MFYIFDIDKFASFEGKTGPYIQYTGARINSLLTKAELNDKFDYVSSLNLIDVADENQRKIARKEKAALKRQSKKEGKK
mgnify:CR=1 FL=1